MKKNSWKKTSKKAWKKLVQAVKNFFKGPAGQFLYDLALNVIANLIAAWIIAQLL